MADTTTKDDETIFSSQETSALDQEVKKDVHDEPGQVEERWRGTRTDRHDMEILGKKQVLRYTGFLKCRDGDLGAPPATVPIWSARWWNCWFVLGFHHRVLWYEFGVREYWGDGIDVRSHPYQMRIFN
ncbi:Amino-acid permease BAT1 protein [Rutstroemia sp. NJR-2017a BBW]|nr:Amino-acid permease BAT1 protein [Rutstroemia sp. NJR-2017a BBW]